MPDSNSTSTMFPLVTLCREPRRQVMWQQLLHQKSNRQIYHMYHLSFSSRQASLGIVLENTLDRFVVENQPFLDYKIKSSTSGTGIDLVL